MRTLLIVTTLGGVLLGVPALAANECTPPQPTFKRCKPADIVTIQVVNNIRYWWCENKGDGSSDHEAQRDAHISFGGRPHAYSFTSWCDCHDAADHAEIEEGGAGSICN